ncbi:MAG: LysR family transcriptional regulator [Ramlibacter sp.]|nr:LysR family transcriptional regulator [Ramlibacter sp.]
MLDAVTLDQLRTFIAAADEGSFSAAGRKLKRAQSVVSQTLANLENQLDTQLFERTGRYPRLTAQGVALLQEARRVLEHMDGFKARAKTMAAGLEPELSIVVDVMFPMDVLTETVGLFRCAFPDTPLRLYVEALGAVVQPVQSGHCSIGIIGTLPEVPEEMSSEPLLSFPMVTVVSPSHPLAQLRKTITMKEVANHVQLVLTDRSTLTEGQSFGVFSPLTWKLADLGAKHAFLKAGFGWGNMPLPMVAADLASGALSRIQLKAFENLDATMRMRAVFRKSDPPGPAGRWFLDQLQSRRA